MCLRVEGFDAGNGSGSFSGGSGAHVDMGAVLREAGDGVVASMVW